MTTSPGRGSLLCLLAAVTLAAPALAANARLERILLLPSVDRSSIVLELTAEPRHVSTRRISDSGVELEAGPFDAAPGKPFDSGSGASADGSAGPKLLKAPAHVRFVDSVTVRMLPTADGPVVRARIVLSALAHAVARSAGRRVYVDVSAVPRPTPVLPRAAAVTQAAAAAASPTAPVPTAEETFRTAVRPSIDKLKEMVPFMTSAAASADPKVTAAILPSLLAVRTSLAGLEPPDAARGSHTMVITAVDRVLRALSPEFSGDRSATVKQSAATIEVVGGVLAGE